MYTSILCLSLIFLCVYNFLSAFSISCFTKIKTSTFGVLLFSCVLFDLIFFPSTLNDFHQNYNADVFFKFENFSSKIWLLVVTFLIGSAIFLLFSLFFFRKGVFVNKNAFEVACWTIAEENIFRYSLPNIILLLFPHANLYLILLLTTLIFSANNFKFSKESALNLIPIFFMFLIGSFFWVSFENILFAGCLHIGYNTTYLIMFWWSNRKQKILQ